MSSIVHASLKRSLLSCLITTALTLPVLAASGKDDGNSGRHFDARTTLTLPASRAPMAEQASALQQLRALVPELRYEIDAATGATRTLSNPVGTLTGPSGGDNKLRALSFLQSHADLLGLSAADVADYEITDDVQSNAAPIRNLYLRQMYQGLPVYNGQLQLPVDNEGRILMVNNLFLPNLAQSVNRTQPVVTAEQALTAAAAHIQRAVGPITLTSRDAGVQRAASLLLAVEKGDASSGVTWPGKAGATSSRTDLDGDGRDEMVFFNRGLWSSEACSGSVTAHGPQFGGLPGDIPLLIRYGGVARRAIFRIESGQGVWLVQHPGGIQRSEWGLSRDIPVPADLDGDGTDELVVFRARTGEWFAQGLGRTGSSGVDVRKEDVAVPFAADLDGDGMAEVIVYTRTAAGELRFQAVLGDGRGMLAVIERVKPLQ